MPTAQYTEKEGFLWNFLGHYIDNMSNEIHV